MEVIHKKSFSKFFFFSLLTSYYRGRQAGREGGVSGRWLLSHIISFIPFLLALQVYIYILPPRFLAMHSFKVGAYKDVYQLNS